MTDQVVPHFHNDLGVQVIEIGAKKFMCMGALPPQDHPHVFCDMVEDIEYVCPYCSTLYRHTACAQGRGVSPFDRTDARGRMGADPYPTPSQRGSGHHKVT